MLDLIVARPRGTIGITPFADESLIGFIYRLAQQRRLLSGRSVAAEAGLANLTNWPPREALEALASVADLHPEALEAIAFGEPDPKYAWFRGIRLSATLFQRRGASHRRVCPECLAEAPYHRGIWDLIFVSICPMHLAILADHCPDARCGKPLRWGGRDLTCCYSCHANLMRIRPVRVTADEAAATMAVYGLLGDLRFAADAARARAMPAFQGLDDGEIIDFLWRFGLEAYGERPKIFSVEQPGEYAWEAHKVLTTGLRALERWPDGFREVMDAMRARWGRRKAAIAVRRWLDALGEAQGRSMRARLGGNVGGFHDELVG